MKFTVRLLLPKDVEQAAALQRLAFPEPFPEEFLWKPNHLLRHIDLFPSGQFAVESEGVIVASSSSCIITEARWLDHSSWDDTVGGQFLNAHDFTGSTLYGVDITVHPSFRRCGIATALYDARFKLVQRLGLTRYGTACRMPDYSEKSNGRSPEAFARDVAVGNEVDRTLTPLLKMGLRYLQTIENYMDDIESGNSAAMLEWLP